MAQVAQAFIWPLNINQRINLIQSVSPYSITGWFQGWRPTHWLSPSTALEYNCALIETMPIVVCGTRLLVNNCLL